MIGDPVALVVRKTIERAPQRLVRRFAKAQTSFIADAQQGFGCLHYSIKGLNAKQKFAGTAVTASGGPRDNLAAMAMLDYIKKGDVLVIATGQDESGAVIGDHWAAIAKQLGAAAIVTDGLVRDAAGIEKLGPPTFARGLSPNAGYRNGPGEVNAAVSIGGMVISPGDILVGDRDGVVVIPRDRAADTAKSLALIEEAEAETEAKVKAGKIRRLWDPAKFEQRGIRYLD
ncbi:MAG: RraA family protein [Pseudomonadota bacterium]